MMLEDILIRITISLLFGEILWLERALKNKPAGLITITLVCTGASMISMLQISILEKQILMIKENPEFINLMSADMGRLGAQVISGIGFLTIIYIMRWTEKYCMKNNLLKKITVRICDEEFKKQ